jgi:hypothetical protein
MVLTAKQCFTTLYNDLHAYLSQWYDITFIDPGEKQYEYTGSKHDLYTRNANYLMYSVVWHYGGEIQSFLEELTIRIPKDKSIIEVGCETAFSGLTLAMLRDCPITIHDYEGLGPRFALWFAEKHGINISFEPYGKMPSQHDWVIATDVMEHSGNHLLFLTWLDQIAKHFAISYPLITTTYPPYMEPPLDEWVDDPAICHIVSARYGMEIAQIPSDGRRYLVYHKREQQG